MSAKSPLRYPGGKTRAIRLLLDVAAQPELRSDILVSPFFGGGSFELASSAHQIFANDLFEPLHNFWQQASANRDAVVEKVREIKSRPFTKEAFAAARAMFGGAEEARVAPIERAALYFAINRSSFSGATFCGGYSRQSEAGRFNAPAIDRLRRIDLSRVTFSNEDFEPFIRRMIREQPGAMMFLDPPYYVDSYLYGKNGDLHQQFDHRRLRDLLISLDAPRKWFMTYGDCEFIRDLYSDEEAFAIREVKWSYGMNTSKKSSEIIIQPAIMAGVADDLRELNLRS